MKAKKESRPDDSDRDLTGTAGRETYGSHTSQIVNQKFPAAAALLEIQPKLGEFYNAATLEILANEFAQKLLMAGRLGAAEKGM